MRSKTTPSDFSKTADEFTDAIQTVKKYGETLEQGAKWFNRQPSSTRQLIKAMAGTALAVGVLAIISNASKK